METLFFALLVFIPVSLIANAMQAAPVIVFFSAALALVPIAKYIGDATEELAEHTGPAIGGLLNATFGNATELIVGLFALHAGLIEVVKASLTGSIIGNLLLVLGTAMLAGGWKRERQRFNATAAATQGSMLLLATIALVMPAIFLFTAPRANAGLVEHLSLFVAAFMIIAYIASLYFTLHTHKHLYQEEGHVVAPRWSRSMAIMVLAASTIAAAVVSDVFVGAITPLTATLGWSQIFIGVVIVAIAGNVGEHFSAVRAAIKDRMDLALQISIGSASQVVMLVAPLLVIVSLFFPVSMNLVFNLFELVGIIFSVFAANAVIQDGESTWLEGFQLLFAYVIMAIAFFFHP